MNVKAIIDMGKIQSKMEAFHWLAIVKQARQGTEWAREALRAENESRAEQGLPTVEQELKQMAERDSAEESRQVNKPRMLADAMKAVRNEPEEMPEWMEKAPIIYRRKG